VKLSEIINNKRSRKMWRNLR